MFWHQTWPHQACAHADEGVGGRASRPLGRAARTKGPPQVHLQHPLKATGFKFNPEKKLWWCEKPPGYPDIDVPDDGGGGSAAAGKA